MNGNFWEWGPVSCIVYNYTKCLSVCSGLGITGLVHPQVSIICIRCSLRPLSSPRRLSSSQTYCMYTNCGGHIVFSIKHFQAWAWILIDGVPPLGPPSCYSVWCFLLLPLNWSPTAVCSGFGSWFKTRYGFLGNFFNPLTLVLEFAQQMTLAFLLAVNSVSWWELPSPWTLSGFHFIIQPSPLVLPLPLPPWMFGWGKL